MLGMVTLLVAFGITIGYAVLCIHKNAYQPKVRNVIRIGAFTLFFLLLLSGVYWWSFRWYALSIMLTIMAALSATWLLTSKRRPEKLFRKKKAVLHCVSMLLLLSVCILPGILFPQYQMPTPTGSYAVETAVYTYTDENRTNPFANTAENRQVTAEFWYPKAADKTFPLVLFSHGAFGVRASNTSTYIELASHGYVVCALDHPYHSFFSKSNEGSITLVSMDFMQEVMDSNKTNVYTPESEYALFQKWMGLRAGDLSFVLDTILKNVGTDMDSVYQLIDGNRIGVMGHSMGGAASVLMGRLYPSIGAVVNIDGPYFSEIVYNPSTDDFEASGTPYTTPILNIYSDDVWRQLGSNPVYAGNVVVSENENTTQTVYIQGAKHMSLTDLSIVSPFLSEMLQGGRATVDALDCVTTMNEAILDFFNGSLKNHEQQ